MNVLHTIDEDLIIHALYRGECILAGPFVPERLRLIQHIPEAENQPGPAAFQQVEGLAKLAAKSERFLVHDEDIRLEPEGGFPDERRPKGRCFPE